MTEKEQALDELGASRVLDGMTWANTSTYRQVLADLSPGAGYTNTSIGAAAYDLMVDRLDRVFQCGRHEPHPEFPEGGSDLLLEDLHTDDSLTDYLLPPGVVIREDLNRSQGWRFNQWRWLRASFKYGNINGIRWPSKSSTKQRVAQQPYSDEDALFSLEEFGVIAAELNFEELQQTLVLAHSFDITTGETQLFLGRPRWNNDGGPAWHWLHNLLGESPEGGQGSVGSEPFAPKPNSPSEVADAPVRLRSAPTPPRKRSSDQG